MSELWKSEDANVHTVRPRWSWVGLGVMIVGLVLIGIGISVGSWVWAIPGIVLLAVGGIVAVYGGLFYDVQGSSSLADQMRDVAEGTEREFPGAGVKRSEDEVKKDVHKRWLGDGE